MSKSEKLLAVVAVLLTVIAAAFWFVNLTNTVNRNGGNDTQNTGANPNDGLGIDGLGGPGIDGFNTEVNFVENFAFSFEKVDDTTVNVVLNGDTENITTAELYLKYDPELVQITEVLDGNLFDLYVSANRIDTESGYVVLAGGFVGDEPQVKTEGVFATIKFTKLTDEPVELIVEENDGLKPKYSQVITQDEVSLSISTTSFTL